MADGGAFLGAQKRCAQCYREQDAAAFVGARGASVSWCLNCRQLYRGGGRRSAAELRAKLGGATGRLPRVLVALVSGNRKLGRIPSSISSAETCPDACPWKGDGCFAEHGVLAYHWRRAATVGLAWEAFLAWTRALEPGALWRHNTAGDLPGRNDVLDVQALDSLVEAQRAARGFTFTAKPLRCPDERAAVARANDGGFTINLSARDVAHADARAELDVGPVAVMVARGTRTGDRTPAGRRIVVCPAELQEGVTCADCGLCRNAYRTGVVGFLPHGQLGPAISRRLPLFQEARA